MTDSSMLIGTNAATMPSITLSNYESITSWGIQYEIFLAEMSKSANIAFNGGTTIGNPRLAGLHIGIEPVSGWALSANREMQFGGGERGGRGVGDFFRALFKPHEYDNTSASLSSDQQFGNQVAAWTSRVVFPERLPLSVYFEYAGEDSSYSGNYRLGNTALSMGIDFPNLWRDLGLTYEVSEWQNAWYEHGVYGDGLRNRDRVIGSWFGDMRQRGDAVGGQSHMVRVAWAPSFGGSAELRYRTLTNESYSTVDYSRAHDLTLRYSYPIKRLLVGGELNVGRDVFGDNYSRLAAFARFGTEDWAFRGSSSAFTSDGDETHTQYFVDLGSSMNRVRFNIGDSSDPKFGTTHLSPHVGIGARRAVSERSDLGARVEFDQVDGHLLLAVRALDYRHRMGRHAALTAFAGVARYDFGTPAYGYYGGIGAEWLNVVRNVDLNFDIRYGDKIARDKLLASDPHPTTNPPPDGWRDDTFYDIAGAALYLSYRW
jgi:hypothetical protein